VAAASAVSDARYGRLAFRLEPSTAPSTTERASVDLPLAVFGGRSHLHSPVDGVGTRQSDEQGGQTDHARPSPARRR